MGNEVKILKLMLDKQGVIFGQGSDTFIVVPRGDMRCRPAGWVSLSVLNRLLADGRVIPKGNTQAKTYILAPSYKTRMETAAQHGQVSAFTNQHCQAETRNIYHPDGIQRPTRTTGHLSVFRKLAKVRDKTGQAFLQADEVEAGERFAADYARSMMAAVSTQNYGGGAGGGKSNVNTAEHISISALDARKRVMKALEFVGSGLDKALNALCCHDMTLGALELSENWAKGAGKTVLKLALARLSEYYGCRAGVREGSNVEAQRHRA